jgi:hypothetical protein
MSTHVSQVEGGNISLQKSSSWRESKKKHKFDERDTIVGLGFSPRPQ